MTIQRKMIEVANRILGKANLQLDTLTAKKEARQRLLQAERRGAFSKPIYPIPACFAICLANSRMFEEISVART